MGKRSPGRRAGSPPAQELSIDPPGERSSSRRGQTVSLVGAADAGSQDQIPAGNWGQVVKLRPTTRDQCRILLYAASGIVPRRARTEWRQEWEAELACAWQIAQEEGPGSGSRGLRSRCCGAFLDAAWYRLNREDLLRTR